MFVVNRISKLQQRVGILFLTVVTSITLSSCGDKESTIASVNGKTISKQAFEAYANFKRINLSDPDKRKTALQAYLDREALASIVEQQNVLDQSSMAAELNEFRKEMLINRYFDKVLANKVSDDAVQNYYTANEKLYETRQFHVAHILLRTKSGMSDAERKVKLTTAQEAYSKLKSGADFAEIAKDYSEDTLSGKKGGDLGWINEGAIDSKFNEIVVKLKEGELSEPFESRFGYHIVKLIDDPRVVKKPFDAVKGDIRYKLRNQVKQAELERLKALEKIKIYEE